MSGPIVRTGATPKFSENWDRIFGEKKTTKKKAKSTKKQATAKAAKKSAKASKKSAKKKKK